MNEMIERVARAIAWHGTMCSCAQKIPCNEWCRCEPAAKRAIAALREPTEAMIGNGADVIWLRQKADQNGCNGHAMLAWRAMIDEALSPPPGE